MTTNEGADGRYEFQKRRKEKENHGFYIYELQHVKIHFKNTSFYLIFQQCVWCRMKTTTP